MLRPFTRWLQQFEPRTEVPDEVDLRTDPWAGDTTHLPRRGDRRAAGGRRGALGPPAACAPATFETLFGLIACAGLRISEALALLRLGCRPEGGRADHTAQQVRQVAPGAAAPERGRGPGALSSDARALCARYAPRAPFFVSTRGRRLGHAAGRSSGSPHLRPSCVDHLGWVDRGDHGAPRIHDLRHSFAVRRLMRWQQQGIDIDQRMLALSTYMGHAKISNTYWYLTGVPELMALVGDSASSASSMPGSR